MRTLTRAHPQERRPQQKSRAGDKVKLIANERGRQLRRPYFLSGSGRTETSGTTSSGRPVSSAITLPLVLSVCQPDGFSQHFPSAQQRLFPGGLNAWQFDAFFVVMQVIASFDVQIESSHRSHPSFLREERKPKTKGLFVHQVTKLRGCRAAFRSGAVPSN